jgi:CDGSH-type Zn-finger protein
MDPVCAGRAPVVLTLEPGTYWWCACGRSKIQPFCDGSHEGTGIEPREVVIGASTKCALCTCKLTSRPPFCDGTHKRLPPLDAGAGGPGGAAGGSPAGGAGGSGGASS